MKIGLVGDVHGSLRWTQHVLKGLDAHGVTTIYQVGDFGIWGGRRGNFFADEVNKTLDKYNQVMTVIPGNHEDWTLIEDPETTEGIMPHWQAYRDRIILVPRGYQWSAGGLNFMAFGGAASIDWKMLTEGVDWWPEEMFRESDLLRLDTDFEVFGGIDVLLTHEASSRGTYEVQAILSGAADGGVRYEGWDYGYAAKSTAFMDRVIEIVDPRMHIHGHMHVAGERFDEETGRLYASLDMNGTRRNVAILDTDKDANSFELEWLNL